MLTVELMANRMVLAHCHQGRYSGANDFGQIVEFWRHGESETWV